ncbi:hypothetical protein AB0D84_31460 [Streptomyces sp. NPDC048193]|uniref:hypothetical protein n=1 Tax=unclassified Streptomyces TaxID=2593676 RepID=UPI003414A965
MTVSEAVLALLRPKPVLSQRAGEPADVLTAASPQEEHSRARATSSSFRRS